MNISLFPKFIIMSSQCSNCLENEFVNTMHTLEIKTIYFIYHSP